MYNVAILTYNQAALFELGCAVELFSMERPELQTWYKGEVVTFDTQAIYVTGGLQITPKTITSLKGYSLLVVPSWPTNNVDIHQKLQHEILSFYNQGHRIISFCSGAFLLGRLGLLNHRQATTHWKYAAMFKQQFPHVQYAEDILYTYDGQLGCSAGSAAAIDLGIAVIRNDFGYKIANKIARQMVISAHREGGQAQFVETPSQPSHNHFSVALEWATHHLESTISVDNLAAKANMSRRTFDRKFKAAFNISPKIWLINQRLNRAKEILEEKNTGIERVAELSGFENATTLRHHFKKNMGVSPIQYRNNFHSKKHVHNTAHKIKIS